MNWLIFMIALLSSKDGKLDKLTELVSNNSLDTTPTKSSSGGTYTASSSLVAAPTPPQAPIENPKSTSDEPYPDVGRCFGECDSVHDPSVVVREDGKYFRFVTSKGITVATADSIGGPWKNQGPALNTSSAINKPSNDELWGPDVFNVNGTYYMYYSVSKKGSQDSDIGVATSKTMEVGTWNDHGSIRLPANEKWNKLDPNLFRKNADSPYLLSFGSLEQGIYQVPMEDPPCKVRDADLVTHLIYNGTMPKPKDTPINAVEGSYQFWWKVDGVDYHYMFWSSGVCCNQPPNLVPAGEEYKIMVCRSKSANGGFSGPALRACTNGGGVEVLASHGDEFYAPGGQGVMYDEKLKSPVLYYHYVNPMKGYETKDFLFGYNKLDFSSGWPVVVK